MTDRPERGPRDPTARRAETSRDRDSDADENATDSGLVSVGGSSDDPEFQVDRQAIRQRAADLLESWESAGRLDRVRSRTRTVTGAALGLFVLSWLLSGSTTGVTSTIASAWLAVSGAVAVTVGAVALLLRGLRNPRDVADKQGAFALFGLALLAVGGTHYRRYPASRAAWRYLVTGPLQDSTRDDGFADASRVVSRESRRDAFPLGQYLRLAGGLSAAAIVAHQSWLALLGRETVAASLVRPLLGSDPGVASGVGGDAATFGAQFTALESALILVGVVVLGAVIGALLSVSRR